jgi:hypothetical protein
MASISFGVALAGVGGWSMRCKAFAGSVVQSAGGAFHQDEGNEPFKMSLYCGLSIFPSLFLGMGYPSVGRSIAMSALFEYRRFGRPSEVSNVGWLWEASPLLCVAAIRRDLRFIFDKLGNPKSSPSSSS